MSHFYTCDGCGQDVNRHLCHDCPGPPLRRADVEEVVQAVLTSVAERLRSRASELQQRFPQATTAILLVADELVPECDRMVPGERREVVFAEGAVGPEKRR